MKYEFTNHARKRFTERFPDKVVEGNVVMSILYAIRSATPNNSVKNDSNFVLHLHESHGWNAFEFLTTDDIVFVCRGSKLVTVFPVKHSRFSTQTSRYRK